MRNLEWLKEEVRQNSVATKIKGKFPITSVVKEMKVIDLIDQVEQSEYDTIFDEGYKCGYKTGKNHAAKQPELPEIPDFVAEWMSVVIKQGYDIMGAIYDGAYDRQMEEWLFRGDKLKRQGNRNKLMKASSIGYTVEEKKYRVIIRSSVDSVIFLSRGNSGEISTGTNESYFNDNWDECTELTEKEIKDYDERYWPFAIPVEDIEKEN